MLKIPRYIRPEETDYDADFEFWSHHPMPMGTVTVSYDVSPLQKRPERFNALLCWCIGKAAAAQDGTLPISFQIHALQMQYADMESFLNRIQTEISLLYPDFN